MAIVFVQPVRQPIDDRPWSADRYQIRLANLVGHFLDESTQMVESMALTRATRRSGASRTRGDVADMTGGAVVGGHVRETSLELDHPSAPTGDLRFAGVDPDDNAGIGPAVDVRLSQRLAHE